MQVRNKRKNFIILFIMNDFINFKNVSNDKVLISETFALLTFCCQLFLVKLYKNTILYYLVDIPKLLFGHDDTLISIVCSLWNSCLTYFRPFISTSEFDRIKIFFTLKWKLYRKGKLN